MTGHSLAATIVLLFAVPIVLSVRVPGVFFGCRR
jgi:hypothetical protein